MKKILLILFLYSLVSGTAFAKVEIWKCERLSIFFYYKIDTKIPAIYIREKGSWNLEIGPSSIVYPENITYLKGRNVIIYDDRTYKKENIYDLEVNIIEEYVDGILIGRLKCKVID